MHKDKRFLLSVLLLVGLGFSFWAGSRVPSLNEKALMGGDTQLDALGFETVIQVQPDDPVILKAIYTTINWGETNRKGMTFGVLFAAVLMSLISLLQHKNLRSGFANSLLGMTIGAPLGVCVNCAAPIAKGLHSAGARVETMFATMVSSPTLNIIVLTMLFALFPLYLVAIKLTLTIGFILIVIPVLVRVLRVKDTELSGDPLKELGADACPVPLTLDSEGTSWRKSFIWLVKSFGRNLWFIFRKTVPLMILAGFLGSLLITLLPWDSMADIMPSGGARSQVLMGMGVVAFVGLMLPVPIAFDVIVPAILLAAGMPIKYVMILLFTLGIFSVYALFIVWTSLPKRVVLSACAVLLVLGVGSGVVAHLLWEKQMERQLALFAEFADASQSDGPSNSRVTRRQAAQPDGPLVSQLTSSRLTPEPQPLADAQGLLVHRLAFQTSANESGELFKRFEGDRFGLDEPYSYSVLSQATITRFRGIATGDVHRDGWTDIVLTSSSGISLYANQQGTGFVRQQMDLPILDGVFVAGAALVDMDNDGWLDIFVATYRHGNYTVYNREGRFSQASLQPVPNLDGAVLTAAPAFGDLDRDGDLDVVLGNWSLGILTGVSAAMASSRNALLINEGGSYEIRPLEGIVGETLSALISDYNNDGLLDVIIGNDLGPPDNYYLGDGAGNLRLLTRQDSIIPHSAATTMSITTADINNDLLPEIYVGQISGRTGDPDVEIRQSGPDLCEPFSEQRHKNACELNQTLHATVVSSRQTRNVNKCFSLGSDYRDDCVAVLLLQAAGSRRNRPLCDMFPAGWSDFAFICKHSFEEVAWAAPGKMEQSIRQRAKNILLTPMPDGTFVDRAVDLNVHVGGWSWNAKFADVDNDEWQDLYIVNGPSFLATRESNLFYRNLQGERFIEETQERGLEFFLASSSYSYVDMDNDGDLDIVMLPAVGPVMVYQNESTEGNSIAFELRDHVGNHFGIGSKITIHYGQGEARHQMREIQASGGFVSFDAPIAHFGLGAYDAVDRVEILWSTGETNEIRGHLTAGARYTVTRPGDGKVH